MTIFLKLPTIGEFKEVKVKSKRTPESKGKQGHQTLLNICMEFNYQIDFLSALVLQYVHPRSMFPFLMYVLVVVVVVVGDQAPHNFIILYEKNSR